MSYLPREAGVYRLRNTLSDHCYVGSSYNMYIRSYSHLHSLNRGTHHSRYLQNAWKHYGQKAFEWEVLELVTDITTLHVREQFWIDELSPSYNASKTVFPAFWLGKTMPLAVRQKMRLAHLGHVKSPEWRAKIGLANSRRQWTDASRAKASASRKGMNMPWLFTPRSAETRAKISATRKERGYKLLPEARERFIALGQQHCRTPEARAKMAASISATMRGRKLSPEHRAAITEALRGRVTSPETRAKQSAAQKGRRLSDETRAKLQAAALGRKASTETREKMREAHRKRHSPT